MLDHRPPDTHHAAAATGHPASASREGPTATVAELLAPVLSTLFAHGLPLPFQFWDGSTAGPPDGPGRIVAHSPDALRWLLWAPGDLGLARAYVKGDVAIEGDAYRVIGMLQRAAPSRDVSVAARAAWATLIASRRLGALGWPLPPPEEEARRRGWRHTKHSKRRDSAAISHHYDVGNDFYRLLLGPSLAYSCARFVDDAATLEDAQASKHDLICRKLGLAERPEARLLDVGCGWGSMALHAATRYHANVLGITISRPQAELARKRAAEAGVADRVEIRLQDYRDLRGEEFDVISSIGMFEHVGSDRTQHYFETARAVLRPGGRMLNHALSSIGGSRLSGRSFVGRYVFPDGELLDVGDVVLAMERAGFEVRDVESLREHYSRTLQAWSANLEAGWDEAVALVGLARARIWRLFMAAFAVGFDDGGVSVHQVLGVVPAADGAAGMPPVRTWR